MDLTVSDVLLIMLIRLTVYNYGKASLLKSGINFATIKPSLNPYLNIYTNFMGSFIFDVYIWVPF